MPYDRDEVKKRTKTIACELCGAGVEVSVYTHRVYCYSCLEKAYALRPDLASSHRYRHSEKGLATKHRNEANEVGKEVATRYFHGEKGWERSKERRLKYYTAHLTEEYQNRYTHQRDCLLSAEKYLEEEACKEKQFYSLKDNISGRRLKVDGWFREHEILLEVQGAQHYLPIRFGGISEERAIFNLRTYQRRERIRQQYCLDNNYRYVVIPFCVLPEEVAECIASQLNSYPMTISRRFHIAYAHKLDSTSLTLQDNEFLFGKCNSPNFHGHNLGIRVSLRGFIDPLTRMVINFVELKRIAEVVLDRFDHKNLNLDFKDFRNEVATAESLARHLWGDFSIELPNISKLELWESEDCAVVLTRGPKEPECRYEYVEEATPLNEELELGQESPGTSLAARENLPPDTKSARGDNE